MCLGCAQCAFVCPTCHCFDIVDEQSGSTTGRRAKNWDACQFSLFTKHASGHNPRDNQEKRYRQRISHKFKYYMDKFDEILCTGCGRCARGCPVSLDILQIVEEINSLSEKTKTLQ
jgi:ferredoxin